MSKMYNVVRTYFSRDPVTTLMGAAYAAELALTGYHVVKATQSDTKYHAVMAGAFGLLATGMVVKEGLL